MTDVKSVQSVIHIIKDAVTSLSGLVQTQTNLVADWNHRSLQKHIQHSTIIHQRFKIIL